MPIDRGRVLVGRRLRMGIVPAGSGQSGQKLRVLLVRDLELIDVICAQINGPLWGLHRKVLAELDREGLCPDG